MDPLAFTAAYFPKSPGAPFPAAFVVRPFAARDVPLVPVAGVPAMPRSAPRP